MRQEEQRKELERYREIRESCSPLMEGDALRSFVETFVREADHYLEMVRISGSPLYIFDEPALIHQARSFRAAFESQMDDVHFYYAVKSNPHPHLLQSVVREGYGLDVSSGLELSAALAAGAPAIVFSGPAKTEEELLLAVQHAQNVVVLMDSFQELQRLQAVAKRYGTTIRAGVRLTVEERGLWRKFGIPLADLADFFAAADGCPAVSLCGLQFHTSWNRDTSQQTAFLKRLGAALNGLKSEWREQIQFLDIGGGYWPEEGEWLQPRATPEGRLRDLLFPSMGEDLRHYCLPTLPITDFAREIANAVRTYIRSCLSCAIFTEPGRWICHRSMHLALTVLDKKGEDLVVTDGGTNIVGWERFEHDYFPVINLTRPSLDEHPALVCGSLCTPHDIWGESYFGETLEVGDILLIPHQGAYTYTLRQNFIKPLPAVVIRPPDAAQPS